MTTRIYTNGWFTSSPEPSNSTSVYTQGWFESSSIVPSQPTDFQATALTFTDVGLTWTDTSSIEDGFKIFRSPTGTGTFTLIATLGPNTTAYVDPNAIPDVGYDYRIVAFNSEGDSTPAEIVDFSTPLPPEIDPGVPPVEVEEERNTIGPYEVTFLSPNVYGVEVSASGDIIGNKF